MLVGITRYADMKQPWKANPDQFATQFLPIPCKLKEDVPAAEANGKKAK